MELKYRLANLDDLDDIELLIHNAIIHMNNQKIEQWDELYPTREDFKQDIINEQLFIGMVGEEIAVIYTLNKECDEEYNKGEWEKPEKTYCIIHRLCVNQKFQNKGIASQTMRHIEKTVSLKGIQAIRLDVYSQNPYALKLYRSYGYKKVGMVQWRKGIFYLMEKYLE